MGRKTDAWMPLYIGDYLRDTMHLTTAQHGAYMLLIMTAWTRGGSLPTDEKFLAGTVKMSLDQWRKNWPSLREFFRQADGTLVQGRVLQEVEKSRKISEVRALAGYKGGSKPKANASQNDGKSQGMIIPPPLPSEVPPHSDPNGSAAASVGEPIDLFPECGDLDKEAWDRAVRILVNAGTAPLAARKFFGKLLSTNRLGAKELLPALVGADVAQTQDPKSYLTKAAAGIMRRIAGEQTNGHTPASIKRAEREDNYRRAFDAPIARPAYDGGS